MPAKGTAEWKGDLRTGTGTFTASSLRYGLERATTGIFWMLQGSWWDCPNLP